MRLARPIKFRNNQLLFAHKPNLQALNRNLSPSCKFKPAILRVLPDNAVDFNECFVMDDIEASLKSDSPGNSIPLNIVIGFKGGNNRMDVFRVGFYYEVNVASHSRLAVYEPLASSRLIAKQRRVAALLKFDRKLRIDWICL